MKPMGNYRVQGFPACLTNVAGVPIRASAAAWRARPTGTTCEVVYQRVLSTYIVDPKP